MKELTQIIDQLHVINEQIVEKDNTIDHMHGVINLIAQMMTDADFIRSEIYLDLRAKYLNQIEDKLKKLSQSKITIEPENLMVETPTVSVTPSNGKSDPTKVKPKHFTKDDVKAPIHTDIFLAPKCRRTYTRRKPKDKDKDGDKKVVDEETKKDNYVSFDHGDRRYYISVDLSTDHYDVYDDQFSIVGHLQGATMTIITNSQSMESETINLRTISETNVAPLFGTYVLDSI